MPHSIKYTNTHPILCLSFYTYIMDVLYQHVYSPILLNGYLSIPFYGFIIVYLSLISKHLGCWLVFSGGHVISKATVSVVALYVYIFLLVLVFLQNSFLQVELLSLRGYIHYSFLAGTTKLSSRKLFSQFMLIQAMNENECLFPHTLLNTGFYPSFLTNESSILLSFISFDLV